MSKTSTETKGVELEVDLSGVEHKNIVNHDDAPILPGEKVSRYRFMTFYLEGSDKNFHDFFEDVVDPEWLQTNNENARALRQVLAGKPNKTWRVLHRVTYVERPALMGFGREQHLPEPADVIADEIVQYFENLDTQNQELKKKVGDILELLKQK